MPDEPKNSPEYLFPRVINLMGTTTEDVPGPSEPRQILFYYDLDSGTLKLNKEGTILTIQTA